MAVPFVLANVLINAELNAEAADVLEGLVRATGRRPVSLAFLCVARHRLGDPQGAQALLAELEEMDRHAFVQPMSFALAHMGLGNLDQAFGHLDRAFDGHDSPIVYLAVERIFDPLRSDPRFAELCARLGLPIARAESSVSAYHHGEYASPHPATSASTAGTGRHSPGQTNRPAE
jgi:hypothetical protein